MYLEGMKILRSLRADIRRTYSFGLVANLGMPGDAQARWSRFSEVAKDLVDPDRWDALERAWNATEQGQPSPVKVDSAPVESAPFKVGDRVRVARSTCGNEVDQHEVGAMGVIVGCNERGETATERRARWRVDVFGQVLCGWHADDELELVTAS